MQNLAKISEQTIWQIIGKAVTSLSTFIILSLVARNYGEDGTGIFTLSITYLSVFYLLSDFGFNAHVLRQGSESHWQKLLGTRIIWSGILAAISILLLPLWPFTNPLFVQAVMLGSLAILASGIFVTCNLIFQSKLRYDLSVLSSSLGTLFSLAIFVYLVNKNFPLPYLLMGHLLGWILIALSAYLLVRRLVQKVLPEYSLRYSLSLVKDSWPIALTLALNVVYFRADVFILSSLKSNAEVGIYNVAYSVFQTALVLPTFIMNAYYPILLKSFKEVKKVGLILFGLSLLGSLVTYLLAPLITQTLTGGGFVGSAESLQILSLGFPAFFLSSLLMWILVSKGRYKSMVIIYGIGLLVNLTLNLYFIPKYSFIGASYITVISEYLILILQAVSLL